MENVILISEENHGMILVAMNEESAKRALLETDWINAYTSIWMPDENEKYGGRYVELIDLFGENWQESYMGFTTGQMNDMGFYFKKVKMYV